MKDKKPKKIKGEEKPPKPVTPKPIDPNEPTTQGDEGSVPPGTKPPPPGH